MKALIVIIAALMLAGTLDRSSAGVPLPDSAVSGKPVRPVVAAVWVETKIKGHPGLWRCRVTRSYKPGDSLLCTQIR